ncbi:phosphotransferase family protein [Novosphingobium cyanobacteriorum]|uniref:Phosphotransferase family protein n=1 Tax=Novosphingobium cyanobacteriorum TaxID=3024215 RepID=A0ABT6CQ81_9SPHN|nr:phosphotransferase family protein [Novosphingobium cyanobacteriorum]MDF8335674.1 phosphotransferase family protein [Novosphingobium cyanobacteriorum]
MTGSGKPTNILEAAMSSTKPAANTISADQIVDLILSQSPPDSRVELSKVRGSGEKTGASSGIILFTAEVNGQVGDYVLRYAPDTETRIFAAYNIGGQARLQHKLATLTDLPVPDARWSDPDGAILGLPGYIMDAVEGVVAHGSAFTGGLVAEATPEQREQIFDEMVRMQGRIHRVDWRSLDLEGDVCSGSGATPVERFVDWFWQTTRFCPESAMPRLEAARERILAMQPDYAPEDYVLVHGDTQVGNYMFRDYRMVAILDWELSGIATPSYDVGIFCNMLSVFRSMATPEVAAIIPSQEDWVARYERINGVRLNDFDYMFKVASLNSVIVSLSMNRGMPEEMKQYHLDLMEPTWSVIER